MRALLTDGWNSAAHVALGLILPAPLSIAYGLYQIGQGGGNLRVDLVEFALGLLAPRILASLAS